MNSEPSAEQLGATIGTIILTLGFTIVVLWVLYALVKKAVYTALLNHSITIGTYSVRIKPDEDEPEAP